MAKHYIEIDEVGFVVKGYSTDFEEPSDDAICINEDGGRHFEIDGIINPPLFELDGTPNYILETNEEDDNTVLRKLTEEEKNDIRAAIPVTLEEPVVDDEQQTLQERVVELEAKVAELMSIIEGKEEVVEEPTPDEEVPTTDDEPSQD